MHYIAVLVIFLLTVRITGHETPLLRNFLQCHPSIPLSVIQATSKPAPKTPKILTQVTSTPAPTTQVNSTSAAKLFSKQTVTDALARYLSEGFISTLSGSLPHFRFKEGHIVPTSERARHKCLDTLGSSFGHRIYCKSSKHVSRIIRYITLRGKPRSITERIAVNTTMELDDLIVALIDTRNTLLKVALHRRPWYERLFLFFINRRPSPASISGKIRVIANCISKKNVPFPFMDEQKILSKALSSLNTGISQTSNAPKNALDQAVTCVPISRGGIVRLFAVQCPVRADTGRKTRSREDKYSGSVKLSFKTLANTFLEETNEVLKHNATPSVHRLWRVVFLSPYEQMVDDALSFCVARARPVAATFWRIMQKKIKCLYFRVVKTSTPAIIPLSRVLFSRTQSMQSWVQRFNEFASSLSSRSIYTKTWFTSATRLSNGILGIGKSSLMRCLNICQYFSKRAACQDTHALRMLRNLDHQSAFAREFKMYLGRVNILSENFSTPIQIDGLYAKNENHEKEVHEWNASVLNGSATTLCQAPSDDKRSAELSKPSLMCRLGEEDELIQITERAERVHLLLKELVEEGALLFTEVAKYSSEAIFLIGGAFMLSAIIFPIFYICVRLACTKFLVMLKAIYILLGRIVTGVSRFFVYLAWIYAYCVEFVFRRICIALYAILWPNRRAFASSQTSPFPVVEGAGNADYREVSQPKSENCGEIWEDAHDTQVRCNSNNLKSREKCQEMPHVTTRRMPRFQRSTIDSGPAPCDDDSAKFSGHGITAISDHDVATIRDQSPTNENSSVMYVSTTKARKRVDPDVAFALRVLDSNRTLLMGLQNTEKGNNSTTGPKELHRTKAVEKREICKHRGKDVADITSDSDTSPVVETSRGRHASPYTLSHVHMTRAERRRGHFGNRHVRRQPEKEPNDS